MSQTTTAATRTAVPDAEAFRAALARDGFTEVAEKSAAPTPRNEAHTHPFEVRGLVLDGLFTLTVDGVSTGYGPGEVFTMAPGCTHAEEVGPHGARYIAGRKHAA